MTKTSFQPAPTSASMPENTMASKMLSLNCIVRGASRSFLVDVESSQTVSRLKNKIMEKEKTLNNFGPSELALFLIKHGATKVELPAATASLEGLVELDELDNLQTHFPGVPDLQRVYIVVELPPQPSTSSSDMSPAAGSKRSFSPSTFQLEDIQRESKHDIPFSRITKAMFDQILAEHGLSTRVVSFSVESVAHSASTQKQIQPFIWGSAKENAQAKDYLEWLETNISLPTNTIFYDASKRINLLSTRVASTICNLRGTVDLAIMGKEYDMAWSHSAGLQVGIELKRSINEENLMQATLQLLSASMSSSFNPVIILTDLRSSWHFFWLEPGAIVSCTFGLQDGAALLQAIAHEPISDISDIPAAEATENTPYRRRCLLRDSIRMTRKETAIWPEESVSSSQGGNFQREATDIDFLPRSDVADMRDVFDVMTEDEKQEWRLKAILEYMKNTPSLQSLVMDCMD
ncbi:hypothetical protein EMPS_07596 [Entomortierella parvispora]|uniref:Crinkler effector protein N-terminal domain-containing protein n=1 Tax=Entomortierella parvispora TaxID=205924 RepID=A0A9P3HEU4_9FUNG|nr:hypothetical protein EMPS_07596 [Entomortierella parvispora]